jgi:predicted nucleotidyltransferase
MTQKKGIPQPEIPPGLIETIAAVPSVIAIILFGSAARGKRTPLSDIDLCIVTEPGLLQEEWETIMSHTGPALDIVIFRNLSPSLRFRVIREGKILLNRDPGSLHRIYADTLREYLDLQPFIERNTRRILGRSAGSA